LLLPATTTTPVPSKLAQPHTPQNGNLAATDTEQLSEAGTVLLESQALAAGTPSKVRQQPVGSAASTNINKSGSTTPRPKAVAVSATINIVHSILWFRVVLAHGHADAVAR